MTTTINPTAIIQNLKVADWSYEYNGSSDWGAKESIQYIESNLHKITEEMVTNCEIEGDTAQEQATFIADQVANQLLAKSGIKREDSISFTIYIR